MKTIKLYGITNCATVKKARAWLDERGVSYEFHDFKQHGVDRVLLARWSEALGWEVLVNRKGTTWRKLDDAARAAVVDADSAILQLLATPSLIKRPVLDINGRIVAGFTPELYESLFQ